MNTSTAPASSRPVLSKPKPPFPGFPLTPHATGKWCKKIRGRVHYFGHWAKRVDGQLCRVPGDGWEQALAEYKKDAEDLHAGRTPRSTSGELTVGALLNRFLDAKRRRVESHEIRERMYVEYRLLADLVVATFGGKRLVIDLAADDFASLRSIMARRWGPQRLKTAIVRTRSLFKFGIDNGLIERPVRFGSEFTVPDKATMRRHRALNGSGHMLEADDVRALLDVAGVQAMAMVLLGINCGLGNADVASLEFGHLDLGRGWLLYPRPKTGIDRRCPLWPETVAALRVVLTARPEPADPADAMLVFLTRNGTPLLRMAAGLARVDIVHNRFGRLLRQTGLSHHGRGFYTLRRVFRTVADGARDPVAIDLVMGHSDSSMGGVYRQRVDDARLVAVTNHVRTWLFGADVATAEGGDQDPRT